MHGRDGVRAAEGRDDGVFSSSLAIVGARGSDFAQEAKIGVRQSAESKPSAPPRLARILQDACQPSFGYQRALPSTSTTQPDAYCFSKPAPRRRSISCRPPSRARRHTMEGDLTSQMGTYSSEAGIIPHALYRILHTLERTTAGPRVEASFIELYNKEL
ncbi:uncharacterized protein PSFLO_00043 [Pseudozyma flocculosa]|uniref:Kinesin motor domain-containing protein n=1 Tax=Pseudozyma flocculosa TaxID=84751 RepID=A0A5C3ER70_9BASI|nr:uncharacterized protein PSFLO_00043 [Pseudozyma flocculosa]